MSDSTSTSSSPTPEPLLALAKWWGPIHGLAAAGITAATMLGVLNSKSGGLLSKGLGAGDIMVTALTATLAGVAPMMAANTVASQGRTVVSPIAELTHGALAVPGGILTGVGGVLSGLFGRS